MTNSSTPPFSYDQPLSQLTKEIARIIGVSKGKVTHLTKSPTNKRSAPISSELINIQATISAKGISIDPNKEENYSTSVNLEFP